jgi:predicted DCC family thiol-disulfide oxidoreductase YuxK
MRPVMIYDGDCEFCRRWVERWKGRTGEHIEYAPYQQVSTRFPQISPDQFKRAVHLVEPDGRVSGGAHAVFRSLALSGRWRWLLWLYDIVPPFAAVAEIAYGFVARHRTPLARMERALRGEPVRQRN